MNWLILSCVAVCASLAAAETYTNKYDNINLDEILSNDKLFNSYFNCIMDKGKCTPEGKELKEHLKDAIQTACKNCTHEQQEGAKKVVNYIRANHPESWKQLKNKFVPNDEYKEEGERFFGTRLR